MRNLTLAIAAVLACAASPALAQGAQARRRSSRQSQAAPKAPAASDAALPSRFAFNRVDDGFLRLDNQTGQIAFCSPHTVGWACQAVPEDRAALEKEIARLQDEVAEPEVGGRGAARAAAAAAAGRPDAAGGRQERGHELNCAKTSRAPAPLSKTPGAGWSR